MAKPTIAELATLVDTLSTRLDNAARVVKAQAEAIQALEEQDTKTRKQLWYLQKIAKGEFAIGSAKPANGEDTVVEAESLSF